MKALSFDVKALIELIWILIYYSSSLNIFIALLQIKELLMKKRIIGMLIVSSLTLGLSGCGGSDSSSNIIALPSDDWEAGDGWTLSWSDEFNGSSIDSSIWTHETGYGSYGWGNDEWQYYTDDSQNSNVSGGLLTITAKSSGTLGKRDGSITSARMVTMDKVQFEFGKIAAKIKVPTGQGVWPAFWMLGANISSEGWPASGEIDILEKVGGSTTNEQTLHGTVHYEDNNGDYAYEGGSVNLGEYLSDDFHVYEIEWNEASIVWKVDGYQYHSINITDPQFDEFKNEFFIILNVAIGGNWPGAPDSTTVLPQEMLVDWIRVYSNN